MMTFSAAYHLATLQKGRERTPDVVDYLVSYCVTVDSADVVSLKDSCHFYCLLDALSLEKIQTKPYSRTIA